MAVVTLNGPLYMEATIENAPVSDGRADVRYAGGRIHSSLEVVTITIEDEATSTYACARLPREAVILPTSLLHVGAAVTGTIDIGDSGNPDSLLDGYAGTADTTLTWPEWDAGAVANTGQPLWQLLGYASREAAPAQVDLFVTLVGATQATADAVIAINFQFTLD